VPIAVYYDNQVVGDYFADMLVEDSIILELKAVEMLIEAHEIQLINYLKATEMEIGLLLNFGKNHNLKEKFILIKTPRYSVTSVVSEFNTI